MVLVRQFTGRAPAGTDAEPAPTPSRPRPATRAFPTRVWHATTHVAAGVPLGLVTLTVVSILVVVTVGFAITGLLAIPVLSALLWTSRVFTAWQRSRFAGCLGVQLARPQTPPRTGGRIRHLLAEVRRPATWRQISYHLAAGVLGSFGFVLIIALWTIGLSLSTIGAYLWTLPASNTFRWDLRSPTAVVTLTLIGLAALCAVPWATLGCARLDVMLARALLEPSPAEGLGLRVRSLMASRAGLVDATNAERRRLERDLHDGTQQRLTALALNLGIAREQFTDLPAPARAVIAAAHADVKATLAELRGFVRGLHPAILDDLGLDAALSGLIDRCPVPVELRVSLPGRLPPAIEAVAYFVVSESLANVAKHAGADSASVLVALADGQLRVQIHDDGRGGADPDHGTGLCGLGQRVTAVDGVLRIDSPTGAGTRILVELPCES